MVSGSRLLCSASAIDDRGTRNSDGSRGGALLIPRSADGQLFARALEQQKRPVGAGYGQRRIDGGLQHVVHGSRRFQCAGHVQHRREPPQVSGAVRGLRHGGDFFEQRRRNAALAADGNLERIFDSEANAVPGAETDAPGLPAVDLQAVAAVAVFDEIDAVLEQDLRVAREMRLSRSTRSHSCSLPMRNGLRSTRTSAVLPAGDFTVSSNSSRAGGPAAADEGDAMTAKSPKPGWPAACRRGRGHLPAPRPCTDLPVGNRRSTRPLRCARLRP